MTERRRVRLLIPDADAARLAVDAGGLLPVLDLQFEADDRSTTAVALDASLRGLGVDVSLVDYVIDQTTDDTFEGPIEVVAELELTELPAGWRWVQLDDVSVGTVPSLQPYVDARLAEWAGAPAPPLRSPWARRGWAAGFRAWIDARLLAHDGVVSTEVVPFRLWGISAVFRIETPAGQRWAKAVFPGFATEPAITAALDRVVPGAVARTIAVDEARGWLLLEHVAGAPVATQIERSDDAIRGLVRLQRSAASHVDELRATGVADRAIGRLANDVVAALAVARQLGIGRVVDDDRIQSAVREAVAAVEALGLSTTLVHGDFHPANVMVDDDRFVIFDWSDAAWSHPLVDVGAWAAWYRDEPETLDRLWGTWTDAWGLAADQLERTRPALDVVVAAYHVVSYVTIARGLESLRIGEAVGAIQRFTDDLEAAILRR